RLPVDDGELRRGTDVADAEAVDAGDPRRRGVLRAAHLDGEIGGLADRDAPRIERRLRGYRGAGRGRDQQEHHRGQPGSPAHQSSRGSATRAPCRRLVMSPGWISWSRSASSSAAASCGVISRWRCSPPAAAGAFASAPPCGCRCCCASCGCAPASRCCSPCSPCGDACCSCWSRWCLLSCCSPCCSCSSCCCWSAPRCCFCSCCRLSCCWSFPLFSCCCLSCLSCCSCLFCWSFFCSSSFFSRAAIFRATSSWLN